MNLPLYELIIDEQDETGVDFIALVDSPAIQKGWIAFSEEKRQAFKADTDRRIVSGPAMIADLPIYRKDKKTGQEYNVVFRPDTIQKIVEKYFRNQNTANFNLMHQRKYLAEGVFLIESMIIDSSRGVKTPVGFDPLPDGSWFISCKVDNEDIWKEFIKTGEFRGFSVEGEFIEKRISNASKVLDDIMNILNSVDNLNKSKK